MTATRPENKSSESLAVRSVVPERFSAYSLLTGKQQGLAPATAAQM
jgi:hypothetical protein